MASSSRKSTHPMRALLRQPRVWGVALAAVAFPVVGTALATKAGDLFLPLVGVPSALALAALAGVVVARAHNRSVLAAVLALPACALSFPACVMVWLVMLIKGTSFGGAVGGIAEGGAQSGAAFLVLLVLAVAPALFCAALPAILLMVTRRKAARSSASDR